MKPHTKLYLKHFGYGDQDVILCECCGRVAVDIHHIDIKGMGGSKKKDYIENLIALCRHCHVDAHANKISKERLLEIHKKNI